MSVLERKVAKQEKEIAELKRALKAVMHHPALDFSEDEYVPMGNGTSNHYTTFLTLCE